MPTSPESPQIQLEVADYTADCVVTATVSDPLPQVPATEPVSDLELAQIVLDFVEQRTGGRVRELQVRVRDRRVVITGRTSSYYNKQLVTHAALEAARRIGVENAVEVG